MFLTFELVFELESFSVVVAVAYKRDLHLEKINQVYGNCSKKQNSFIYVQMRKMPRFKSNFQARIETKSYIVLKMRIKHLKVVDGSKALRDLSSAKQLSASHFAFVKT